MNIRKYNATPLILLLLAGACTIARAQTIAWTQIGPGIWKATIGRPEAYDLLTASGATPYEEGLKKMSSPPFPLPQSDMVANVADGKTFLRFPLEKNEQIFGFGLNFQTVHQRGKILQLHVDHYGGRDNGRTHAPTPFYVSSKGYGVFINSARYLEVYAGTAVHKDSRHPPEVKDRNTDKAWTARPYSDAVEVLVPAGGVDIYLFAGPSPLDAVRRFNLMNGGGCLPPRWGLGFTQRVRTLDNAAEVLAEVSAFRAKGFPLDFIGLEPGWQSKSYPCTFEWDKSRFPEPAKFVRSMLDSGIRINLWTNPYISPDAPFYKQIAPYTGSHTVWTGLVPDFTMSPARDLFFGQLRKDQVDIGVSGYKIDEVDGYDSYLWPDVATFPSGVSAEQTRQTFGVLSQRYTTELYRQKNHRTFGLVRGSNGGAVSFPYVIYNDYYNHEDFITALINSGFAGVLWTPEVRASKSGEEWLRRIQTVIFSPMAMINAWASGTKPWSYPEVAEDVRQLALLRMRMMPYWYTEFAKYHFEGIPPFRAINLEAGFSPDLKSESTNNNLEENPYAEAASKEIKDQYMAGEYLLVAPIFAGQTSRKVILPKGRWYDFYTGEYAGDGQVITVTPGLNKIPVYVKDGAIIPMMPPLLHTPQPGVKTDLEIRHYGEKPGHYQLYDDDGASYDYEKGAFSWRTIEVLKDNNGRWKGSISAPEKGKPNTVGAVTWKFMTPSAMGTDPRQDQAGSQHSHFTSSSPFVKEVTRVLRKQVFSEAAWAMQQSPITVTAASSSRSAGGRHDFFSEADYWWPNPQSPDSPYIQRDGMTNPENFVAHRQAMIRFSRIVGALASAYKITGNEKYVRQALDHCRAWFADTATCMNPSLQFAQAIKGRATGRGIGIIDTIQLMEVVQGLLAMEHSTAMDKDLLERIRDWFTRYLRWLTTHPYGKDEMSATNNHGTCWVMQVAAFARFTGDSALMDLCRDRFRNVLLPGQMAADGSFPQELRRTKPYGYSLFNLDAMATICQLLSSGKDNCWNYETLDGRSVRKGIGFMYPFVADKGKWPYPHDIMYWQNWPVAQPFLVFGANAYGRKEWLDTWARLDHSPQTGEIIRNLPVRHPLIWLAPGVPSRRAGRQAPVDLPAVFGDAVQQARLLLREVAAAGANTPAQSERATVPFSPRTLEHGQLKLVASRDWTSGFFPGELWLLYDYTRNDEWKKAAESFTARMEQEKTNGTTHDMGFKIYCSYGNGYRLTNDPHYKDVILEAARTLSTRFNPVIGCIRSWDHHKNLWGFPVIIDNMMNLELLFEATRLSGDSSFYKIAVSHANTTMKNHFRSDYSSFHVVDYDTLTGKVVKRMTWQGYSDSSAWARGQAWGLYAYTMCYRETGDRAYLQQAEHIAAYILSCLPSDKVPYWDFDAPGVPRTSGVPAAATDSASGEPRDASAAAVIASGLYELSGYSRNKKEYLAVADKILKSLTANYRSPIGQSRGFILLHSTGAKPANSEVDVPLNYADYYYMEALLRSRL